ncbi:hypothetical protein HK099_007503 [Clydaea vesicula]|uniref:Glycosyl transferase family 25 domain-containing protein n=1 Tax=Clydaea vesicula TaxID=447962 RepID=A0AAD5XTP5_9FUNG|nr:hypothetical protein HK099_007503 [Clydaea vesicula]
MSVIFRSVICLLIFTTLLFLFKNPSVESNTIYTSGKIALTSGASDSVISTNLLKSLIPSYLQKVNDYFGLDMVYIMNLKKRPDRLETQKKIFKLLDSKFTLIESVDKFDTDQINAFEPKNRMNFNSLAIKMSHLKALDHMSENGYNTTLIMEDDADLDRLTPILLPLLMEKLPEDWQKYIKVNSNNRLIYKMGKSLIGTVAYIVNKKGCDFILDFAKNSSDNWDIMFGPMFAKGLNAYSSDLFLADHMGSTKANPSDGRTKNKGSDGEEYTAEGHLNYGGLLMSSFLSLPKDTENPDEYEILDN